MVERKGPPFKEPAFRPDGAATVVETTAWGLATMAMIGLFAASRVGERLGVPGSKTVGNKLEYVLYTEELIKKRRERRSNNSRS